MEYPHNIEPMSLDLVDQVDQDPVNTEVNYYSETANTYNNNLEEIQRKLTIGPQIKVRPSTLI